MKRIILIVSIVMMLSSLLTGCAQDTGYSIKICGFSDSVPGVSHRLEYKKWSNDSFIDANAKKEITVSLDGTLTEAEYIGTEKRFYDFYNTHEYKDSNGHHLAMTEDGQLCMYFWGSSNQDVTGETLLTEAECVEIARSFMNDIVDVADYTVQSEFDPKLKVYTISFSKDVGGFRCADQAEIRVEENGHIYSFSSTMLGQIPTDSVVEFNLAEIESEITAMLDDKYGSVKASYDRVSYSEVAYTLTIDENGEFALVGAIDVKCINEYGEHDEVVFDRIQFMIQQ